MRSDPRIQYENAQQNQSRGLVDGPLPPPISGRLEQALGVLVECEGLVMTLVDRCGGMPSTASLGPSATKPDAPRLSELAMDLGSTARRLRDRLNDLANAL